MSDIGTEIPQPHPQLDRVRGILKLDPSEPDPRTTITENGVPIFFLDDEEDNRYRLTFIAPMNDVILKVTTVNTPTKEVRDSKLVHSGFHPNTNISLIYDNLDQVPQNINLDNGMSARRFYSDGQRLAFQEELTQLNSPESHLELMQKLINALSAVSKTDGEENEYIQQTIEAAGEVLFDQSQQESQAVRGQMNEWLRKALEEKRTLESSEE